MIITAIRIHYLLTRSEASKRIPSEVRSSMGRLFASGLGLFAFGFFIWNLDNIFCTDLTRQKVAIGWPAAFLLEGALSAILLFSSTHPNAHRARLVAYPYCEILPSACEYRRLTVR